MCDWQTLAMLLVPHGAEVGLAFLLFHFLMLLSGVICLLFSPRGKGYTHLGPFTLRLMKAVHFP